MTTWQEISEKAKELSTDKQRVDGFDKLFWKEAGPRLTKVLPLLHELKL